MSGQSANMTIKQVKSRIDAIETNKQTAPYRSTSGAETNKQLGRSKKMQEDRKA